MAVVKNPLWSLEASGNVGVVSYHLRQKRSYYSVGSTGFGDSRIRVNRTSAPTHVARKSRRKHKVTHAALTRGQPLFRYWSKAIARVADVGFSLQRRSGRFTYDLPSEWYRSFSGFGYSQRRSLEAVQAYTADDAVIPVSPLFVRRNPPGTLYKHSTVTGYKVQSATTYRTWLMSLMIGKRYSRWFISTNFLRSRSPDFIRAAQRNREFADLFPAFNNDPLTGLSFTGDQMFHHFCFQLLTVLERAYVPADDENDLAVNMIDVDFSAFRSRGDREQQRLYDFPIAQRRVYRG